MWRASRFEMMDFDDNEYDIAQGLSIAKKDDATISHMIRNRAILLHHNIRLKILTLRLRHDCGTINIVVNW